MIVSDAIELAVQGAFWLIVGGYAFIVVGAAVSNLANWIR